MTPASRHSLRVILATGIAALLAPSSKAASYTYTGPNAGTATTPIAGNFSAGDSWVGETVPIFDSTTDLNFTYTAGTAASFTATNDLGAISLNSLSLTNSRATSTITISGGTLNFLADAGTSELPSIVNTASGSQISIINSAISLGANMSMTNSGSGQIQIGNSAAANAGNIDLGNFTLTLNNGASSSGYQFGTSGGTNRGIISGTGSIVQSISNASATVAYFGPSTFSGGYTLNSGVLVFGVNSTGSAGAVTNGSIGTGVLTINGGTIRATSNGNRLTHNNVIAAGNFTIGETATATGMTLAGNITLTGNRTISVAGGGAAADLTGRHAITGVISDGGSGFGLSKTGANSLVLSAANTYSGTTNVLNGAIFVAANVPSGAASPLGNATSPVSLGGAGSVVGGLIGLYVGVPGATPGASTITVARDITVGNVNGAGGTTTIGTTSDTDAVFSGNISLAKSVLLNSTSTGSRLANFTGIVSGTGFGVNKTGVGTARLSNTNTYTGSTTIRTGTLLAGGNVTASTDGVFGNAASAILLGDATSAATDNITLGIDGAFTIGRDITVNANNSTGLSTLTALNAAASTATYGGNVTIAKGVVLANGTAGAKTLFTGAISDGAGSFGVTINGPGTVEFGGAGVNAYDGGTTVTSGTLLLNRAAGGNNTITGGVTINGGNLVLGANEQLPDTTVLTLSGGTFDAAGFTEKIFDLNYTGGTILNGGNLTITGSQDRFLFDGSTVDAPESVNRHILYLGSSTTAAVNAALALDNDASHDLAVNDGAAAVDVSFNAAITNDGSDIPTSLIKKGLGTVDFNVANSFGGVGKTLDLQGGVVEVTADNQLGHSANTITLNGGTLRFASAFSTARTFVAGTSAGSLEVALGLSQTIGSLSGSGIINKTGAGELIITGDQSTVFSGSTSINGGTLSVSALNNILGNAASDLTINGGTFKVTSGFALDAGKTITIGAGGGAIQVEPAQTLDLAVAGSLAGGGVFSKTGSGLLIVRDANAGLTAGAGVNVNAGVLELRNAQSLGNAVKATITLGDGQLQLTNDAATSFSNPVTIAGNGKVQVDVATGGAAAVSHTLGALTIGGTLTATSGSNVLGVPGVIFGATSVTANTTITAESASVTLGAVGLGSNSLFVAGARNVQTAAISGGPGAGLTAITKTGNGVLTLPVANTFTGNVVINGGVVRGNNLSSFGNSANVVRVNAGGTAGIGVNNIPYALELNGGTVSSTGITNGTWSGLSGSTPSITFLADTVFNLWDGITPTTDADVNFGTATTGVVTSNGPVNISVFANATNTTFSTQRKLRFSNTTDGGSVTGMLTVNPNAVAQIRSNGTNNSLGSGVLIRLNTGVNTVTPENAGRIEFLSETDATFGNNIELLGDSTIGVGRVTSVINKTMTVNNLTIGANTLSVVDASGAGVSNDNLTVAGTTTLTGNATFQTVRNLTVATISDGAGTFGINKSGAGTLTLNGGGFDGATTISAGSLILGASGVLGGAQPVTITGGTLNLGATTQSVGAVSVTGSGVISGAAGGQLTTSGIDVNSGVNTSISAALAGTNGITKAGAGTLTLSGNNTFGGNITVSAGAVNLGADNVLPDTANIFINGTGSFSFSSAANTSRTETIAGVMMSAGTFRTANGTSAAHSLVTINNTLEIAGGDFQLNTGTSLSANKVILSGGVQNLHVIGGNSTAQPAELTVGAGGMEFTGTQLRMNTGAASGNQGSRVILNGNVTSFASTLESGFWGNSSGNNFGVREINVGTGTRAFFMEDGTVTNDFRVDFPLVGSANVAKVGDGRLQLNAANTYSGETEIAQGTLGLASSATLAGSPSVHVGTGATFDVSAKTLGYNVLASQILKVDGTVLGSTNVFGTLSGTGMISQNVSVSAAGVLAPGGSPGVLGIGGTLTFSDSSVFSLEFGGATPGNGIGRYDQVNVGQSVAIGTNVTLNLSLSGGYVPTPSDTFFVLNRSDLVNYSSFFLNAAEGATVDLGNGFSGTITYQADWTGTQGGSSLTGGNDIAIYSVVPEPGGALLLVGGLALVSGGRRRRKSA